MVETTGDNSTNEGQAQNQAEEASGATAKKRARTAKRASSRPGSLKRKKAAANAPQEAAIEDGGQAPLEKEPKKLESRAKKARPRAKAKAASKSPARSSSSAVKEKTPYTRKSSFDEERYQIKSHPDGTQFKVKVVEDGDEEKVAPRRRRGGPGPGPALVDLEEYVSPFKAGQRKINLGALATQNRRAVTYLKRHLDVRPKVAVILGSGLSQVADICDGKAVPFSKVPGFLEPKVHGHPGQVRAGMVGDVPTLFAEGRVHYYECLSMKETVRQVRTYMALGVEYFIFTTSAGALNKDFRAGDIMFVRDHINLMGSNPMLEEKLDSEPSPFVDTSRIYEEKMIGLSERICRRIRVRRREGVLAGVQGPVYETPAERRWLRTIGADAVCMSVIPEAIAAASAGVPVAALALIANDEVSMKEGVLTHEAVAQAGEKYAEQMKKLVKAMLAAR